MSYLKNTLNFASYAYKASTNTPALAKMKDGTIFEVAVAGLQTVGGTSSYCAVNDSLVYKNGGVEFLSKVTVKLNATTMKPDGHATLVVTMAQLAQDGRIVRISVAGTIAVIGDVNIDDTLIYIGGNWKIIPIKAILADISDTAPLNNKFLTDEHLVDWFTSAGRCVLNNPGYFRLPGGIIFQCGIVINSNNGGLGLTISNFPIVFPTQCFSLSLIQQTTAPSFTLTSAMYVGGSATTTGFNWLAALGVSGSALSYSPANQVSAIYLAIGY